MKTLGIWYFEYGWLVMMGLGLVAGWFSSELRTMKPLFGFIGFALAVGLLMAYLKHS